MELALIEHELFMKHEAPQSHPERPERLAAAREGLQAISSIEVNAVACREATSKQLCRVHTESLVQTVAETAGKTGWLDQDTFFAPDSYQAALLAAGSGLALVEALQAGADYGLALVRPPGHHARPNQAMGFCLFNNVAVCAAALQEESATSAAAAERILILDWDVHHGNGTQDIFYDQQGVLYVSMHESPQYPGTGSVREVGQGEGEGYTVNIPMPSESGDAAYSLLMQRLVVPIVQQYQPQWTLISAGYDAHVRDPLGGMELTGRGYANMTHALLRALPDRGQGHTLLMLEGGYDLEGLRDGVGSTLQALFDMKSERQAPEALGDEVLPSQERAIQAAVDVHSKHWQL